MCMIGYKLYFSESTVCTDPVQFSLFFCYNEYKIKYKYLGAWSKTTLLFEWNKVSFDRGQGGRKQELLSS